MSVFIDLNSNDIVVAKTNSQLKSGQIVDVYMHGHVYRCKVSNANIYKGRYVDHKVAWARPAGMYIENTHLGTRTIRSFVADGK